MGTDGGRCPTISIKWRCAAGRALEHSRTGLNSCLERGSWNLVSSGRTEFFTRALAPDRGGVPRDKRAEHRIAGDLGGSRWLSEPSMAKLTDFSRQFFGRGMSFPLSS